MLHPSRNIQQCIRDNNAISFAPNVCTLCLAQHRWKLLVLLQSIQCSPLTTTARHRLKAYRHTTMELRWALLRKGVSSKGSTVWGNPALTQATYSSPISRCQCSSRRRCRTSAAFQAL
jgi:hypothetical protein